MPDTSLLTTDEDDPWLIPDWLRVENRVKRNDAPAVRGRSADFVDPVLKRQQEMRNNLNAQRAERIKAKNAKGLAKVKEKHANERYDRKRKIWVPK